MEVFTLFVQKLSRNRNRYEKKNQDCGLFFSNFFVVFALVSMNHETADSSNSKTLNDFYYKLISIAGVQNMSNDIFGPWICWSMIWSIFSLGFTIYFATQAQSSVKIPVHILHLLTLEQKDHAQKTLYFNVTWSLLQIAMAISHVMAICLMGGAVNEMVNYRKSI